MIRPFDRAKIPRLLEPPFDWSQTRGLSVALEIGCGNGEHAIKFAQTHPQIFLIAIERTTNKFQSFTKKLKKMDPPPPNLVGYHADAIHWCAHNLGNGPKLSQIFLLYPNPYPKEKQANLRFANMPFMGFLLKHLKTGGQVTLATNIYEHYLEAHTNFSELWGLETLQGEPISPTAEPRTAFERKYLERGETCYNLVLKKP